MAQGRTDSLAKAPAYREIMARCCATQDGGHMQPQMRWFLEPFGYAEVLRAATQLERRKGADLLKVLRKQGFDAVQGVGGVVNFSEGPYELTHRTMVYAPPKNNSTGQNVDKYMLAARMLRFPNSGNLTPQTWV